MGTYQNMNDDNEFSWLLWDDPSFVQFSFDEANDYPGLLSPFPEVPQHQQTVQGQLQAPDQWIENTALDDLCLFTNTRLDLSPALDFDMMMTEDATPTNTNAVWTPSGGSMSPPGTLPSTASDAFSLSPCQMSMPALSPRPLAPRPIAPQPQYTTVETPCGAADQVTPHEDGVAAVPRVPNNPAQIRRADIARNRRRKRDGSFIPKRIERRSTKPVKCHACPEGFAYKSDFKKHLIVHHKADALASGLSITRPVCDVCSRTFSRADHLKRHKKRKHGGS